MIQCLGVIESPVVEVRLGKLLTTVYRLNLKVLESGLLKECLHVE
jgi:hypothetical protein